MPSTGHQWNESKRELNKDFSKFSYYVLITPFFLFFKIFYSFIWQREREIAQAAEAAGSRREKQD